ncbi:hypothetical protein BDR07DRAFT_183529 [Suillus spraguei]|nr:hypothetical protein BDR07DRAFT_183529 [Suillus spraguei]
MWLVDRGRTGRTPQGPSFRSQLRSFHRHSTEMTIQNFIWSQEDQVIWFHVIHSCIRELCNFPSWSTKTMVSLLEAGKPLTSCESIGALVYAKVTLVEVAVTISINLVVQPVTNMYSSPKNSQLRMSTISVIRVFQPAAKTRSLFMNPSNSQSASKVAISNIVFQPGPVAET